MTPRRFIAGACLLLILALPATPLAQTSTGMVVGTVTDSSKAVIPGVTITLTNTATNVVQTTVSLDTGVFRFPFVVVGGYRLTVELMGFQKSEADLTVTVGQTTRVDPVMHVGAANEVVEVAARPAAIQTESGAVQTVVRREEIENLPLNGRNFIQLVALQPNAVPFKRTSLAANRGGYNVVAGAPVQATGMTIDGVNVRELVDPRTTILLNPDLIEEFQSATSNYSAAHGGAGGAQVNLVTKSGTNAFHGSAYGFFRNDKFDARNFFAAEKPPFRQNQFGGTFGGPLLRDKVFFYGGYEGSRIVRSLAQRFTVPTIAERQGNFQGLPQIFDPLTYNPATGLRQPFPGNIVPADRISPEAAKALELLWPLPNQPGRANNLSGAKPDSQDTDQFSVRADYVPTSRDTMFARHIYFNPRKFHGNSAALPNFADNQDTPAHNLAIGHTRTLNARMVNQLRLGYFRFVQILEDAEKDVPINKQIGITGTSDEFLGNPAISITGIDRTGAIGNSPNNRTDIAYYINDDLLFSAGNHGLSVGVNLGFEQFNGGNNSNSRGSFSFTNQYTRQVGQPSTGVALADFLLGYPATASRGVGTGFRNWRQNKYALYIADDWKATRDLTLNVGLRYEYAQPTYEKQNNVTGFDPTTGTIVQLGTNGTPRGLREPYRKDFQPRIGMAYRPGGSNRTVLRTGYGVTFLPLGMLTPAFSMGTNPPFFLSESYVNNTLIPDMTLRNAFPAGRGVSSTTLSTIDPDFRDPYIQQWNFAVERELPQQITLELGYVGNKGSRLGFSQNINAPAAGPGTVQSKRPYPAFSTISSLNSLGASTYHSMVIKSQRRFSDGLAFLASYTWGKSLSTPAMHLVGDGASGESIRNPLDPGAEKGRDVYDVRHRFVGSFIWHLPFGRGHRLGQSWPPLVDHFLGGWRVNGILTLMSGYGFTPQLGFDNANTGNNSARPDVLRNPNDGPKTVDQWFDTGAFTLPAQYSYGNAGKNIIDGPPTKTLDFSVFKEWRILEGSRLQFRTEFFNLTNTVNLDQPGATFGTSTFGVISSAGDPRQIQFALKLIF